MKNTVEHFLVMRERERGLTILQTVDHGQANGAMMFKMGSVVTNFQVV